MAITLASELKLQGDGACSHCSCKSYSHDSANSGGMYGGRNCTCGHNATGKSVFLFPAKAIQWTQTLIEEFQAMLEDKAFAVSRCGRLEVFGYCEI